MMKFPIYGKVKVIFQTTNQVSSLFTRIGLIFQKPWWFVGGFKPSIWRFILPWLMNMKCDNIRRTKLTF